VLVGYQNGSSRPCRQHGDGPRALHATESLQGCHDRVQTPGVHGLGECLVEPLAACGMFSHRTDLCLKHAVRRRGRPDDLRASPEMGRAPMGPAGVADSMAEHERCAAQLGILAIAEGIVTGAGASAVCVIIHSGTYTTVRTPERASLASCTASLRSVLTRSPAFVGIRDGATPQQSSPLFVRER
jgi:hypothetical protein